MTNTLSGLRGRRSDAEEMLKSTIREITTRKYGQRSLLFASTSSTENGSDPESQQQDTAPTAKEIRLECSRYPSQVTHSDSVETCGLRNFWNAQPKTVESDQSSVSTMAGGTRSDDEDSELDVLSGIDLTTKSGTTHSSRRSRAPSSDDFGSFAGSNPNTPVRKNTTASREALRLVPT